jgi:hypothetical protein
MGRFFQYMGDNKGRYRKRVKIVILNKLKGKRDKKEKKYLKFRLTKGTPPRHEVVIKCSFFFYAFFLS